MVLITIVAAIPAYRRIGQEVLTFATNLNSEIKINDSQSGFRAFSKNTFETFKFNNTGMGIESEMIADAAGAGFRIKEVPITCRYDVDGSTFNPVKHGLGDGIEMNNNHEVTVFRPYPDVK